MWATPWQLALLFPTLPSAPSISSFSPQKRLLPAFVSFIFKHDEKETTEMRKEYFSEKERENTLS